MLDNCPQLSVDSIYGYQSFKYDKIFNDLEKEIKFDKNSIEETEIFY